MAEFVELRSEDWIQELEQLKRLQLFSADEIKRVAEIRKQHEYKLQAKTKEKDDYLNYIRYEINLKHIVEARREMTGNKQQKSKIEYSISKRICKLFEQVILRFSEDVNLWMSYFKYCKSVKFFTPVSKMLTRMLQTHSGKPELWVFASEWELNQCLSTENARDILMKALRHHPDSEIIYSQLFLLELKIMSIKLKEKKAEEETGESAHDKVRDAIIQGSIAEAVFLSAAKKLNSVEFIISLLAHCQQFTDDGSKKLEQKMIRYILENFSDEEETWDVIARRQKAGLMKQIDENVVDTETDLKTKDTAKEKILLSTETYKQAVKKIPTEKMWSLYMDFLSELIEKQTPFRKLVYREGMEACVSSGMMSTSNFFKYCQHLKETGRSVRETEVLKLGTDQYPTSVELWSARLDNLISKNADEGIVNKVFQSAVNNCKSSTEQLYDVWKKVIHYYQTLSNQKVEDMFKLGLKQSTNISNLIKPDYLEWMVLTNGIQEGRNLFNQPVMHHPPCLKVVKKMIELESIQAFVDVKHIQKCFEQGVTQFGKSDHELWMDYIKFEVKSGNPANMSNLHFRAMNTLTPQSSEAFSAEFNIFNINS